MLARQGSMHSRPWIYIDNLGGFPAFVSGSHTYAWLLTPYLSQPCKERAPLLHVYPNTRGMTAHPQILLNTLHGAALYPPCTHYSKPACPAIFPLVFAHGQCHFACQPALQSDQELPPRNKARAHLDEYDC